MISVICPSIRPQYLKLTQDALERQTFQDFEFLVEIGLPSRGFTLPTAMNDMIRRAKGDIIVSLQDCIDIPDDFLEKVSKLDHSMAYTFPIVKRGLAGDWRSHKYGEVIPECWEIDLACAPKKLFYDVGGFDETYCNGWSYDNVEIALRAKAAGWKFFCDNTLKGDAIDHDAEIPHPFRKKLISNQWRIRYTQDEIDKGNFKLDYLSTV